MEKPCMVCGRMYRKPSTTSRAKWDERLYCSYACQYEAMRGRRNKKLGDHLRGKTQSPEHRAKRVESIKRTYAEGTVEHARANLGLRAEETTQWKGEAIGYRAAHTRLYQARGKPGPCEFCGTESGPFEWALSQQAPETKEEATGRFAGKSYSTRLEDYLSACQPCHREYDGRERDPRTGRYL